MVQLAKRLIAAKAAARAAQTVGNKALDVSATRFEKARHPKRGRRIATGAALPAAAAGSALAFLFDPASGKARRASLKNLIMRTKNADANDVKGTVQDMQERSKQVIDLASQKAKNAAADANDKIDDATDKAKSTVDATASKTTKQVDARSN